MTIKLDNSHRYIITIVPFMWILGAGQLVDFAYYLKEHLIGKKIKIALASIGIVGISVTLFLSIPSLYSAYPDLLVKVNYQSNENQNQVYEFISQSVESHDRVAVFGSWDYQNSPNVPNIKWHIEVRKEKEDEDNTKKRKKAYSLFWQMLKKRDQESYLAFINFLKYKDVTVEEYHLLSFMKVVDEKSYKEYRRSSSLNPFSDKIADLNALDSQISCIITILNPEHKELMVHTSQFFDQQKEWIEYNRNEFDSLGIIVILYKKEDAYTFQIHNQPLNTNS
jgi:hypothetical protein